VGSGLCVTQPPGANASTALAFAPCGAGDGSQTWYKTGVAFSNTTTGFGADCVNWNCGNGFALGATPILYRCGNQTQWNSRWDTLTPDTPGLFQALSDASPTGYCRPRRLACAQPVAVVPALAGGVVAEGLLTEPVDVRTPRARVAFGTGLRCRTQHYNTMYNTEHRIEKPPTYGWNESELNTPSAGVEAPPEEGHNLDVVL
jgi:hypothetical protein